MLALLGFMKDPASIIKGLLLAAVLGCVGYVVYDYFDTKSDLAQANKDLIKIEAERDSAIKLVENERNEVKRVNGLLTLAKEMKQKAEIIYVDRQVKVVEYRNDPTVQHCDLDVKWMQLSNTQALSPYSSAEGSNPK